MNDQNSIITLTHDSIDQEHICCAISDKRCRAGVSAKKEWLKQRLPEGLRFKRLNVRHKVFIEYLPAEHAWAPIDAPGYMFINCFWVAGSYKGKGYGTKLLEECINDALTAQCMESLRLSVKLKNHIFPIKLS